MKQNKKSLKISNKVGKMGEDIACMFLMKRGYKIIARNYLKKWGELDIIAEKNNKTLFVEVKSVSCVTFPDVSHETAYRPEDNVHSRKLRSIRRAVESYLLENKAESREWSFSVITIHINLATRIARIELISNVVL